MTSIQEFMDRQDLVLIEQERVEENRVSLNEIYDENFAEFTQEEIIENVMAARMENRLEMENVQLKSDVHNVLKIGKINQDLPSDPTNVYVMLNGDFVSLLESFQIDFNVDMPRPLITLCFYSDVLLDGLDVDVDVNVGE